MANTRPSFYKLMLLPNLIRLRIPPDFKNRYLANRGTDEAKLKSPSGDNWEVKLLQDDEGDVYFVEGWPEFVNHHSLGHFEFLVFKYNGEMSFDVRIFDKNGTVKEYRPVGPSHQEPESSAVALSFPFFKKKIEVYSIGSKSYLLIPKDFWERHLPRSNQEFMLRNSEGISWSVRIIASSNNTFMICGGWKAFADDNSIKKGDTCIFELVGQNTMQVRILRENA